MINKKLVVKSAVLLSMLAGTGLAVMPSVNVAAAELNGSVTEKLNEDVTIESGVSYIDANGKTNTIEISKNSMVRLNATANNIVINANGQRYNLSNVKEVTFKNITVSNLVPFYSTGVTKVTLDGVDFQKGVDFSGMRSLQELIVKNSNFGSLDYSLAIHSAQNLHTFIVDNSTLNADLRIYDNRNLSEATISNSVLKDDATQYSNKKGFKTNYVNSRIERPKGLRVISSGGMSANDIFTMNPGEAKIGDSKFDASKSGTIFYSGSDKEVKKIDIPKGVTVKYVDDVADKITIRLSDGNSYVLNGTKELYFRNANIQTPVAFTQAGLKLESLKFVNSKTQLIDVAYSNTIKEFEIHNSEVSQSSGYVSVYNNKAIENFIMQNSKVNGTSGYISVYNNQSMKNFIMNNDYTYGYLSTYNLGNAVLQLSNSQYDDYISSTNVIEGEAGRQVIGYAPEIVADNITSPKFMDVESELRRVITASDVEDGDLTSDVDINVDNVNIMTDGEYPVTITVKDSDGNVSEKEITVTIRD